MNSRIANKGFTLVEILVVLVIISILVGLVLSVVGRAREAALRTQCTANLKQIGVVLEKHRDDQGDYPRLPLTDLVRDPEILRCPSDRTKIEPGTAYTSYEYVYAEFPLSIQQGAETGSAILVVCHHHTPKNKALVLREGGAVKWETLPAFLQE